MVAAKGKLIAASNRVAGDRSNRKSVGSRNFKIFSENEKVNVGSGDSVDDNRRKSVFNKGPNQGNSNDSKGNLKGFEKDKGKRYSSFVQRKALADVSNVQGNCSDTSMRDQSKSVVSLGQGTIRRKPFLGKVGTNLSQGSGVCNTSKTGIKSLIASSNDKRSKVQGRESVNNTRRSSNLSHVQMRKSLPISRRVNKVDTRDVKEDAENSEQSKGKSSFFVKTKADRKVVPLVSNTRTNLWRNRASDGFIMLTRSQTNVDAPAIPKRPFRPALRTAVKISNAQTERKLKSKQVSRVDKSVHGAAISSKNKVKLVPSSLPKHTDLVDAHQPPQGELPLDGNVNTSTKASDINNKRKSERRKSFTSSLIARSKPLEEHGESSRLEKLPSIDDNSNHLDVAEYVEEIYQYYWVSELENPPLQNYMSIQSDIAPHMRGILINWLIEVHFKFDLMPETLYLMVTLLDQYLSMVPIKKNEMQLVGLTALLLASKYEDFWHPRVKDLISISAESYTREQMLEMERAVLNKLKFRLNAPTPYVFMLRFLKAAQSDKRLEHLAFYLIDLCLVEYEALKFRPSLLCASSVYLARFTLQRTPAWTPLLRKHARYEESQLRDCAEMILKFQKAAKAGQLRVTYEKYMRPEQSSVAAITPLNRLPVH